MRNACIAAAVLLTGCSFYADEPDGPPAWPGENLPECTTTRTSYVIDAVTAPTDADIAEDVGADLDGDGTVDNQFGNILSALGYLHFEIQNRTDEALAADALLIGLTLEECELYSLVEVHRGVAIDRTVDPPVLTVEDTTELASVDRVRDSRRIFLRGSGTLPPTALFEAEGAEWIPADGIEIELDAVDEREVEGQLAAGIRGDAFHDAVVPVIHRQILTELEGQPGCPEACEDEDLADVVGIFDENGDFEITLAEVGDNSLVRILDRPDLDLMTLVDGEVTYWPRQDDIPESLSFGLGFHASAVEIAD